jgi:hypothetical protein
MRGTGFRHRTAKLNSLRLEAKLTEDDEQARKGRPLGLVLRAGLARSGEDRGRWRGARHRQPTLDRARGTRAASFRVVPLQQATPCEGVCLVGNDPNPLCETLVEFQLHDAPPQHHCGPAL